MIVNETPHNRISEKFAELQAGGRKALISFITAGDPDLEKTKELIKVIEKAGSDIIELGVPYSDPLADGPVIQEASQRALKAGATLKKILQTVREVREETNVPIVLMTYYNPLLRYGLEALAHDAAASGVDGFIVPDLPVEESQTLGELLTGAGLYLIPLVAPTSGSNRIKKITENARGFVYCVSLTGVTGTRNSVATDLGEFISRIRKETALPLAVGFGISTPEQAASVASLADGVIVGSAFVKTIGELGKSDALLDTVYNKVRELKQAVN